MTDFTLSAPTRSRSVIRSTLAPRLAGGLAILLVWEGVVRALAPPFVAKPSGILIAIPKVIVDPAFLGATAATLLAVAEGLAIALVVGTVIGLAMGRSAIVERSLRH